MGTKNLLIITNSFPDQEDRYVGSIFVKEQVKYLREYFNNIYIISPAPLGIEYIRKVKLRDYQFDNVKVIFPKYMNIPLFYFLMRYNWTSLEKRVILKTIQKEKINFDLIHSHFTWPSGAVAFQLKRRFKVPLVITEHTSETFKKVIKRKDYQYIKIWSSADAIIRVRKEDIHLFNSVGIPLSKVYYIPNGYDQKKFKLIDKKEARQKIGLPLDRKIILNIGSLYKIKGHIYLIKAMKNVIKQRIDVLCIIVGIGKLRDKLKKQIIDEGLENYVTLVGGKPHSEIPFWINACDIFVLPSLNEGNPTVMFECLGCGKPFIGTKVGGIPEIITMEEYGLLCEPADPKDLAEKILIALEKEWDREKIIKYADQFTWENIAQKVVEVYENTIKSPESTQSVNNNELLDGFIRWRG